VSFNIVLVEPEIPQNTGNIARTCVVAGATLHLIKPLGFELDEKQARRAGMDYWKSADVKVYENLDAFFEINKNQRFFLASTKAKITHSEAKFEKGDFILFGKETKGLPEELIFSNYDKAIRIPMGKDQRSLNLSNAVAIVLYEALRQNDYFDL
jgi:tRNA (cytidine/uridine-2'-O-)-methyltransferase